MMTTYVRAGFSKLKDGELVIQANTILQSLTANEAFLTPVPSLEVVQSAVDDFRVKLSNMYAGNEADTLLKNQSRTVLADLLRRLGYYVNEAAGDDFVALYSSGFPVSSRPYKGAVTIPAVPRGLVLGDSNHSGTMRLDFAPVKDARLYLYRYAVRTQGAEPAWSIIHPSTSSRNNVLEQLLPGMEYLVQVKSVNSAGASDWSDAASLIAR